ncbi:hypothetical protein FACS18949_05280 [Clostridia bacterium]|nr:hypothetical protein FACS18949_05280 [Clostridia bacterium]
MKYANGTQFTRIYDKFEYYREDLDCIYCANFKRRGGNGCGRSVCEFADIKDETIRKNRLKRPRGWNKDARSE